jgi:hypothetical protein
MVLAQCVMCSTWGRGCQMFLTMRAIFHSLLHRHLERVVAFWLLQSLLCMQIIRDGPYIMNILNSGRTWVVDLWRRFNQQYIAALVCVYLTIGVVSAYHIHN